MRHPLQNSSLTPRGFVIGRFRIRVAEKLRPGLVNGDLLAGKYWEKVNRLTSKQPLPVDTILHNILPGMTKRGRFKGGESIRSAGKCYYTRDIMVLSTFMQWFGTSVGFNFLTHKRFGHDAKHPFGREISHPSREFTAKLAADKNIVPRLLHVCTQKCGPGRMGLWYCAVTCKDATDARDRLVVDALMYWLGTREGREYVDNFASYVKKMAERIRNYHMWKSFGYRRISLIKKAA